MEKEMTPLEELTKEINDKLKAAATVITKCHSLCESCKGPAHDGPLVKNYINEIHEIEDRDAECEVNQAIGESDAQAEAEHNADLEAERDHEEEMKHQ